MHFVISSSLHFNLLAFTENMCSRTEDVLHFIEDSSLRYVSINPSPALLDPAEFPGRDCAIPEAFLNCYKLESTRERLTRGHHSRGYHFFLLKLGLISFSHYNHYFEI